MKITIFYAVILVAAGLIFLSGRYYQADLDIKLMAQQALHINGLEVSLRNK